MKRSRLIKPLLPSATEVAGEHVKPPLTREARKQIQEAKLANLEAEAKEGRDNLGRFTKNNSYGKGNPLARQTQILRFAAVNSIDPFAISAIIKSMIRSAKRGNVMAAKLLLERSLGRMQEIDKQIAESEKYDDAEDFVGDPKYQ
jgi:hypothetical protein